MYDVCYFHFFYKLTPFPFYARRFELARKLCHMKIKFILEWTTSLDTSSRTLFVREGGSVWGCPRHVELRNNVRLLLNVELRNYVISRQIVERRVMSDCYLNIVVSLDC